MTMSDDFPCPYCSNIAGVGQRPPDSQPRTLFDSLLAIGETTVLVPTVGLIVPGYLLAVTREHVLSFAQLPGSSLREVERWLEQLLPTLSESFGEYLVFEHGSGGWRKQAGSGACLVHAHLHLIPGFPHITSLLARDLDASRMDSLEQLTALSMDNYVLMGRPNHWYATAKVDLPGQWIRRRVAAELGRPEEYDWAVFAGEEELAQTLWRIPSHLPSPP